MEFSANFLCGRTEKRFRIGTGTSPFHWMGCGVRGWSKTAFLEFVVFLRIWTKLWEGFHGFVKVGVAALVVMSWTVGLRLRDVYPAIGVFSMVELFFSQVHL